MSDTQTSYGLWLVPPDLDVEVLVAFFGGESSKGVWFACLYQQNMNHMVPEIASNVTIGNKGACGSLPPVAEYNRVQENVNPQNPERAIFEPLAKGLCNQGLFSDMERGPSSTSARNGAPSTAYGLLTPRGNSIAIDDDPDNEHIRFRTRNGTQILIHNTTGYVYIISGNGNTWLEVSDTGLDAYSRFDISFRAGRNINLHADGNINIQADGNTYEKAKDIFKETSGNLNLNSKGLSIRNGSTILDNTVDTPNIKTFTLSDIVASDDACCPTRIGKSTIVSRMPTHEPWDGHPKTSFQNGTKVNTNINKPSGAASRLPDRRKINVTASTEQKVEPLKNTPGEGTKTEDNKRIVKTGEGENKPVTIPPNESGEKLKFGKWEVSVENEAAIREASEKYGVSYEYMMAQAAQESRFDNSAKAKTSSATGMYQFVDGTWNEMATKYPNEGLTPLWNPKNGPPPAGYVDPRTDPTQSATAAALYAKQNEKSLAKAGVTNPTPTDYYMGHFMGGGGAQQFMSAKAKDPNQSAAALFPKQADANRTIFYNKDGSARSVNEVYKVMDNKISGNTSNFKNSPTLIKKI